MKTALMVIVILFILAGAVWILQGVNLLGGSFMSGQGQWTLIGSVVLVVGVIIVALSRRKRSSG